MSLLVQHRCVVHAGREAAARCPSCRQYFCRECVTEHDGRLLCAACLRRLTSPAANRTSRWKHLWLLLQLGSGILLTWLAFHLLGQLLLETPSEWHEGKAAERLLLGPP